MIPKRNKPKKWRMIVDLSSPEGYSVNDGISQAWSTLEYATVDHLATLVWKMGRGAHLVKSDVKEAYWAVPVHPQDQWLLGIQWKSQRYIDCVLPFGLRSAPKIFSALADTLQWILVQQGVAPLLHYLDDFILVAPTNEKAMTLKTTLVSVWDTLGVPSEPSKLEGPSTIMTFLGMTQWRCSYDCLRTSWRG